MKQDVLKSVDALTVQAWLQSGEAVLVDVREANEVALERIAGARHLPLSTFDPTRLVDARGRRLVLQCLTGARSARAGLFLVQSGFDEVYNLTGGILGWKAAGLPVVAGGSV
ncbi:MAG: rhodanese-like domain-containing protein [Alphaproteobacteria bacterium]|nr:rhodanese-like domain-containing protein [Alphaproteobacteria bacterium]